MMRLPEKIRRALEKVVKEMMAKEEIYGLCLFGSWSRGDAVDISDVDLLIFTKDVIADEYVERITVEGVMIDLNFVQKSGFRGLFHRSWIRNSSKPKSSTTGTGRLQTLKC